MMNANAMGSECSSGCESGWTLYLDHSFHENASSHFIGEDESFHNDKKAKNDDAEGEEEDLSMVSDASSGPPHFPPNAQPSKAPKVSKRSIKRQKVKENQVNQHHLPSFLDDTASSPRSDFSMNNIVAVTNQQTSTESMLDYSQGFSATYFEERSSLQDHFGFLQPSLSQTEAHNNKWNGGKEMGMM